MTRILCGSCGVNTLRKVYCRQILQKTVESSLGVKGLQNCPVSKYIVKVYGDLRSY